MMHYFDFSLRPWSSAFTTPGKHVVFHCGKWRGKWDLLQWKAEIFLSPIYRAIYRSDLPGVVKADDQGPGLHKHYQIFLC